MAPRYDGHCRNLSKEEVAEKLAAGIPYVIRQKMPTEGTTSFQDEVYGLITVDNDTLDDQVLIKADGMPTYNFANVVDDQMCIRDSDLDEFQAPEADTSMGFGYLKEKERLEPYLDATNQAYGIKANLLIGIRNFFISSPSELVQEDEINWFAGEGWGIDQLGFTLEPSSVRPVSYTHLDVYKRQEQDCN